MKSAVEKLDPTRVKLTVEVTAEELEPHLKAAYAEIGKQISVPGFRKGKVPARIIDQRVGRGYVMQEAVNPAIDEAFRAALEENELFPMSRPEVDVVAVPGVEDATELKFTAELDVRPEINIPDLSGLELTVDSLAVDAESVEEELTRLRERFASLTGVDREAQAGDFLSLDLQATIDDKVIDEVSGVSHEIGSGNLLEGLDEAVTGAKAGETVNFTTKLAGGEHAGQEADVQVTVTAVKVRELPEVDDEFAQLASEFDTVEELRADLEKTVRERAAAGQAITARDKLVDHLLETVTFDLPKTPVEEEVKRHLAAEGKEEDDEHAAEVRADVEKALRAQLLLDVLAEKNEVEITQGELIEFLLQTAQQYGVEPGQFISGADRAGQIPAFASEVRRNKAIALALRNVTVKDSDGEVVDLEKFVGSDAADAQAQVEALAAQAAELVESDEAAATVDAEIERLAAQAAADIEAGDGDEA
ncbi:trigger factor [Buchananella hordeovulneris]|uniref:Trigger factor n=1 Tax=Buchananella hordeovulneris TaxID=52770 RepID=A0A1Q5PXA3_9ACTO|nr:trigger factor [Buchananella hordeovulneris]MDO5080154.1 trigger factor [Buchananella hordeovulneris]OKL52092.1 trigger factor [Buchananella hordeovulneris]RRD44973.1 trigger factor [Buchananella hordeovulneris]RRD53404.1 trigger factor [Buchananella hordeovulneris]